MNYSFHVFIIMLCAPNERFYVLVANTKSIKFSCSSSMAYCCVLSVCCQFHFRGFQTVLWIFQPPVKIDLYATRNFSVSIPSSFNRLI